MKNNHIPAIERIQNRISKMQSKLDNCWKKNSDRYYQFCYHCDLDIISINMRGHRHWCPCHGLEAQINHYQSLLKDLKCISLK